MPTAITSTGDSTIRDADILAAIDAAEVVNGVKHIHFGSGVFYISQVRPTDSVSITGEADAVIHAATTNDFSTDGLWLRGDGSSIIGPLQFDRHGKRRMITIDANLCVVNGVTIDGDPATAGDADNHGLRVNEGCKYARITRNVIDGGGLGVYLSRSTDDAEVSDNTISNIQGQHGIYANHSARLRITGNTIRDTYFQGINLQVDQAGGTMLGAVIEGNTLYAIGGNGIGLNCVTGLGNCSFSSPVIRRNRVVGCAGWAFRFAATEATDAISDVTLTGNGYADVTGAGVYQESGSGSITYLANQFTSRYDNRLFAEDWTDTSAWTFDAGDDAMAGVSGGVLTVTNTSGFGMTTTSDVLPTDEPYTVEFVTTPDTGSVGGTYKWRIQFITGTGAGTVRCAVYFDDTDLELSDGTTDTDVAPPDWQGANTRVKIIMWVDPVNLKMRAWMLHMGTSPDDEYDALKPETGGSRATYEAQDPVEITLAAAPTKIRLATGGTNGVSTIESIEVWPLGTPGKGDSILTGSGEPNYAPVPDQPSRSEDPDGTLLEYLEQMGTTSQRHLNFGKGGDTLIAHIEPLIDDFFPLSSGNFILWAGTNDITAYTLEQMQAAMNSVLSKATAAGITLHVFDALPRTAFNSAQDEQLLAWNAWLSLQVPATGHKLVPVWREFISTADSTVMQAIYDDDGVHPTDEGYALASEVYARSVLASYGRLPLRRAKRNVARSVIHG